MPVRSLTCTWVMPGSCTSTGSSRVTTFRSGVRVSRRAAYSVEVLPLPVGPVMSTSPWGEPSIRRTCRTSSGTMPSSSSEGSSLPLSSSRSTTFSPWIEGRLLDARVDGTTVEGEVGAAVLGHAAFRDVEPCDDLQAAHDCVGSPGGHLHDVAQDAVDAIADAEPLLLGLDVYVARACVEGSRQDGVDEAHHRRGLDVGQRGRRDDVVRGVVDRRQVELLEDRVDGPGSGAAGVRPGDEVDDLALGRDPDVDLPDPGDEAHIVQHDDVERVGEGDDQAVGCPGDHDHAMSDGEPSREHPDQVGVRAHLGEVDHRQAHEVGDARCDVVLGDQTEVDEDLAQASAVSGCRELGVQGDLEVEGGEPSARHEHSTKAPPLVAVDALLREREGVERRGGVRGPMSGRLQGHPWSVGTRRTRLQVAGG